MRMIAMLKSILPLHIAGRRAGTTVLEMLVATVLLAALLSITAKALVAVQRQARSIDRRAAATIALENALEEMLARPWSEVNDAAIGDVQMPPSLLESHPQAALTGTVETEDEPVLSKRISLKLTWGPAAEVRPLSLTTWIYRQEQP